MAGCSAPSSPEPSATDPPRLSEASSDDLPAGKEYSGTWALGSLLLGFDNGRSYPFTLKSAANVTIVVDVRGPAARDAGASIGLADGQGNAAGPVVASSSGPAQTHRELTVLLVPGDYYAHAGLRDGAWAEFTMTVSFAP